MGLVERSSGVSWHFLSSSSRELSSAPPPPGRSLMAADSGTMVTGPDAGSEELKSACEAQSCDGMLTPPGVSTVDVSRGLDASLEICTTFPCWIEITCVGSEWFKTPFPVNVTTVLFCKHFTLLLPSARRGWSPRK